MSVIPVRRDYPERSRSAASIQIAWSLPKAGSWPRPFTVRRAVLWTALLALGILGCLKIREKIQRGVAHQHG